MSEFNGLGGHSKGFKPGPRLEDDCKDSLLTVIEKQIIPRLLNVQNFLSKSPQIQRPSAPLDELAEFKTFTQHCLDNNALRANAIVDDLSARGVPQDQIFLALITPAARHLGVLWEQDRCSFTQVTCGLAIMHQTIYRLGYESPLKHHAEGDKDRLMLACAPGSQHFLGLTIVAEFFRQAGTEVVLEISSTESELLRAVANEWFDVVGISVALDAQLPALPGLIANLRKSSGNRQTLVVLGGPIFSLKSMHPQDLGADAIFTDANDAVAAVKQLVRAR